MKHAAMAPPTISAPIQQYPLPIEPHSYYHHNSHRHSHFREKVHFAGADSRSSSHDTPSQSYSSSSSSASTPEPSAEPQDLHALALKLLDTLYNKHDLALARTLIHPDVHVSTNNDDATLRSRDEYLAYWARRTKRVPDLRARCRECAVDEAQRKVWCVSELYMEPSWAVEEKASAKANGVTPTRRKESVDMLWFDESGRLVGGCDWVRSVRWREGDDD
jgi:hypothetical protein